MTNHNSYVTKVSCTRPIAIVLMLLLCFQAGTITVRATVTKTEKQGVDWAGIRLGIVGSIGI